MAEQAITPEEFIRRYPEAMRALCDGRAAVMPLWDDKIVNRNPYAPPEEVITRVSTRLAERLDPRTKPRVPVVG